MVVTTLDVEVTTLAVVVTILSVAVTTLFVDTIVVINLCGGRLVDLFNTLFCTMKTDLVDLSVFFAITFGSVVFFVVEVVVFIVVFFCDVVVICVLVPGIFLMQLADVHLNVKFFVSRPGFEDFSENASKILEEFRLSSRPEFVSEPKTGFMCLLGNLILVRLTNVFDVLELFVCEVKTVKVVF